jgi:hypothetical protein
MGEAPWRHGVAAVRLAHRVGGHTLTNVFHVADLGGGLDDVVAAAILSNITTTWAFGYLGFQPPALWQGSDASVVDAWILWLPPVGLPRFLKAVLSFLPLPGEGSGPALPANVTVPIQQRCEFGGHFGVGWSFFPWLTTAALSPSDPDTITDDARRGLVDSFNGIAAAFADALDPFQYRLCVYHRNGRLEPDGHSVAWWDPVVGHSIRSTRLAELKVRLPAHGRRG